MNKLRAFDPIQHEKAKATFTAKHTALRQTVADLSTSLQNKAQEADKLLTELKKLNSTKAEELRIKVDALAKDLTTQIDGLLTGIPSIEDKSTTEEIQKATQALLAAHNKYDEDAKSTLTTLEGNIATIKKAIKAIAEKTH